VGNNRVAEGTQLSGGRDGCQNTAFVGDVGADERDTFAQFVGKCFAFVLGQVGDDNRKSLGMQTTYRGLPQTAGSAGHDRRIAGKCL
jgi:hypothetical protein